VKLLVTFFLFTLFAFASSIEIGEFYLIDSTNSLSFEQVAQDREKFQAMQKYNFGVRDETFWIMLELHNSTSEVVTQRVYNKRAGLDYIDVYVLKNDALIETYSLGDMRHHNERDNIFRVSYFDITLEADEKVVIFIKHKSYATMDVRWQIDSVNSFTHYYNNQAVAYSFIIGILSVTSFLSFLFFLFLKNKFYIIYALFSLCTITYQLSFAGFFYQFGMPIYLTNFFNYFVPTIGGILLGLFPIYFFNLRKNEFYYLISAIKIFISISFIFAIMFLLYPLDPSLLYNSKYSNISGLLTIIALAILALRVFIAKKSSSFFYLVANFILLFFLSFFILGLIGAIEYSDFYYYSLPIGAIGQDLFLGVALIHTTYLIKVENEKNRELMSEYSKLTFIGQTMLNISHQWKSPINNIFNSINHMQAAKKFNDPNLDSVIDRSLANIKETTLFLKDTALGQLDFYKSSSKKESINLYQEINFLTKLIESEFSKKSINVVLAFDKNLEITIDKNYFLNVLMVLFENSYRLFEQRNIKSSLIKVEIFKNANSFELRFEDNARGAKDDIDKIFDKSYSMNNSTGLGLYLAKEIVEHKLEGTITAENKNDGICFVIVGFDHPLR